LERVARTERLTASEQARNRTPANSEWEQSSIGAKDKESPSKNEQTRSSIDHTFVKDRFMPGEEDGLRDDFLGGVPSIRHIAAVPRRQIRHACARQPAVRGASAPRRRRIANAFWAAGIRGCQLPITLDKSLAT
jgi:hypothetical protein